MRETFLRIAEASPVAVVLAFVALNGFAIVLLVKTAGFLRRIFSAK